MKILNQNDEKSIQQIVDSIMRDGDVTNLSILKSLLEKHQHPLLLQSLLRSEEALEIEHLDDFIQFMDQLMNLQRIHASNIIVNDAISELLICLLSFERSWLNNKAIERVAPIFMEIMSRKNINIKLRKNCMQCLLQMAMFDDMDVDHRFTLIRLGCFEKYIKICEICESEIESDENQLQDIYYILFLVADSLSRMMSEVFCDRQFFEAFIDDEKVHSEKQDKYLNLLMRLLNKLMMISNNNICINAILLDPILMSYIQIFTQFKYIAPQEIEDLMIMQNNTQIQNDGITLKTIAKSCDIILNEDIAEIILSYSNTNPVSLIINSINLFQNNEIQFLNKISQKAIRAIFALIFDVDDDSVTNIQTLFDDDLNNSLKHLISHSDNVSLECLYLIIRSLQQNENSFCLQIVKECVNKVNINTTKTFEFWWEIRRSGCITDEYIPKLKRFVQEFNRNPPTKICDAIKC